MSGVWVEGFTIHTPPRKGGFKGIFDLGITPFPEMFVSFHPEKKVEGSPIT